MNTQKALEWLANGEVGISSKTMCFALLGIRYDTADMPYDADDLRRCLLFCDYAEVTDDDLKKICNVHIWWQYIYNEWAHLLFFYEEGDFMSVYRLLDSVSERVRAGISEERRKQL